MPERNDDDQALNNNKGVKHDDRQNDLTNPVNESTGSDSGLNSGAIAQTRNATDVGAGTYSSKRNVSGSDLDGQTP